jgi:hypothetical protein
MMLGEVTATPKEFTAMGLVHNSNNDSRSKGMDIRSELVVVVAPGFVSCPKSRGAAPSLRRNVIVERFRDVIRASRAENAGKTKIA